MWQGIVPARMRRGDGTAGATRHAEGDSGTPWQQRRGKSSNEEPQTAGSAGLDPRGATGTKKDPAPGAPTEKQQMMETRTTMKTTGRIVLN
uniref:Uncharacterized protein n=1 Tax=Knipowitschia caucasica TaxID=637954 RepID=A0AAV2LB83_KNICA